MRFQLTRITNNCCVHFRISSILSLKIGRWYEYRVAAVNQNGTRGYSHASKPFQLNESESTTNVHLVQYLMILLCCARVAPKTLPSPMNFTIEAAPKLLSNNSVYTRVAWKSPVADYPIEKFEFTWSFYIREGDGSLFMERALLPEVSGDDNMLGRHSFIFHFRRDDIMNFGTCCQIPTITCKYMPCHRLAESA